MRGFVSFRSRLPRHRLARVLNHNMTPKSIALVGRRRTGKDTVALFLRDHYDYVPVSFAEPLKRAALALDPIVIEADQIVRLSDAWPPNWYGAGDRLSDVVTSVGWEVAKDNYPEVRRILQRLGDEAGRQIHGEDTWIRQARRDIDFCRDTGRPVVVSDVRYPNEAAALRDMGFTVVRLTRYTVSRTDTADTHASEAGTDSLPVDAEFANLGTVNDLVNAVKRHLAL